MNKHLAQPKALRSKIRKCECSFKFSSDADILRQDMIFFFHIIVTTFHFLVNSQGQIIWNILARIDQT